jgi:OOP family OmpA-OmpF porin
MKKLLAITALVLTATAPALAHAEPDAGNPSGPYIGGGWGRFNLHIHNLNDVGTAVDTISDAKDNAWKVFAGYRFNPYWSLEAAYIDFGSPGDRFQASGSDGSYRVKMSGFAPSLVGTIPLGPVELSAKVGYYLYDTETRVNFSSGTFLQSKHGRSDFLYGAGVGMTFFDHFNARVEYERINIKNATDSNAMWLTGAWRF